MLGPDPRVTQPVEHWSAERIPRSQRARCVWIDQQWFSLVASRAVAADARVIDQLDAEKRGGVDERRDLRRPVRARLQPVVDHDELRAVLERRGSETILDRREADASGAGLASWADHVE